MKLELGFAVTWESTCRCCGEKNKIIIQWNGSAFEIQQEDKVCGDIMLHIPFEKKDTPKVVK